MSEFNLICHGMMLFQERASDFLILMPEIKEHSFKYGTPLPVNPTDPSKGCQAPAGGKPVDILANFEITFPPVPVDYTLTLTDIPPQTGNVLRNPAIVSPANLLMIDGSKVEVIAQLKRVSISVPKPDQIVFFKKVQPPTGTIPDILHGTDPSIVLQVPTQVYDVVVFRYIHVPPGSSITFQGNVIHTGDLQFTGGAPLHTLCIYSQTELDETALPGGHRTGINDLIHYNGNVHPTFDLSMIGVSDDPPLNPGFGIDRCQLVNLFKLHSLDNIQGSCAPAAVTLP